MLGDPVAHSVSPAMHQAAFQSLGLDAKYVALAVGAPELPARMREFVAAGGGGNVTVPHKGLAAVSVDEMRGPIAGACNTFWGEGDRLVGSNTDVHGVLDGLASIGAPGSTWLLLGTGGSAQAVLAAARERGARVAIRSRSEERKVATETRMAAWGIERATPEECQVVINATPLGLRPDDPLPILPSDAPAARWVLDLVYRSGATALVEAFHRHGAVAADGRVVLVSQGAAAFEQWFGRPAPRNIMRAAVDVALG